MNAIINSEKAICAAELKALKCCVIIPTYNNDQTLAQVIKDVSEYCHDILVVNDGSTDQTKQVLEQFSEIHKVDYLPNSGKGCIL